MQYKYDDYDWCTEHESVSEKEKQAILNEITQESVSKRNNYDTIV